MNTKPFPADIRQTRPRQRILEVLRRARGSHLSAEDIHRRVNRKSPQVHLATVYRTLGRFTTEGLVMRSSLIQNHAEYGLNGRAGIQLLCEGCGQVRSERLAPAVRLMKALSRALGKRFSVTQCQVHLVGRCNQCAK